MENGQPLADVRIKRVLMDNAAHSMMCSSPGEETITDAEGRFRFPSETRFSAVVPLYGDPWAPVNVCSERTDGWLLLWDDSFLGRVPPLRMEIVCDIGSDARPGQMCR